MVFFTHRDRIKPLLLFFVKIVNDDFFCRIEEVDVTAIQGIKVCFYDSSKKKFGRFFTVLHSFLKASGYFCQGISLGHIQQILIYPRA